MAISKICWTHIHCQGAETGTVSPQTSEVDTGKWTESISRHVIKKQGKIDR